MEVDRLIELGEIRAVYGIKGWLKVYSFTRPIEQIFDYLHWHIGDAKKKQLFEVEQSSKRANSLLVAKLSGLDDRTDAEGLVGAKIFVDEEALPSLSDGEYYWSQLIGLEVINLQSERLGVIKELIETGANDVLVVKSQDTQQLIPYGKQVVKAVNIDLNQLIVDWETDLSDHNEN